MAFDDWEIVPTEIQEEKHNANLGCNIFLRRQGSKGEKYVLYILFCAPEPEALSSSKTPKIEENNNNSTQTNCIEKLVDFTENSFPKECQINGMIIVSLFSYSKIPDRLIHELDKHLLTKGTPEKAIAYIIGEQNGPKHWEPIADEATCICAAWGDFLTHDGYGLTGRSAFWRPYILKWKNAVAGWLNNEYPDLRGYLGFFPSYPINLEPCDHTFVIARLPQNLT